MAKGYFMDSDLPVRALRGFHVVLTRPMAFCYAHELLGLQWYTVPKGFKSDMASVPRFLWPLLPPHGRVKKAAILHDWLYSQPKIDRAFADLLFLEAMKSDGVPWLQRWAMYLGVRAFGGFFRNH